MDEQDDYDAACWAQAELEERRQREDEAIARCRPLAKQFERDIAQFEHDIEEHQNRRSLLCR